MACAVGTTATIDDRRVMTAPNSPVARGLATQLLAGARRDAVSAPSTSGALSAADRAGRALAAELARWFGSYGYHALLTRALTQARAEHPALRAVHVGAPTAPYLDGLADAATAHGTDAIVAGVEAVLAALIDLLGRLIGEDLAVTFIDRTMLGLTTEGTTVDASEAPRPRPGDPA